MFVMVLRGDFLSRPSYAKDHHLGRLDEGGGLLPDSEAHFPYGIGGDYRCDALATDGKGNLGHNAIDRERDNPSD